MSDLDPLESPRVRREARVDLLRSVGRNVLELAFEVKRHPEGRPMAVAALRTLRTGMAPRVQPVEFDRAMGALVRACRALDTPRSNVRLLASLARDARKPA